jgi:hypothetical protein
VDLPVEWTGPSGHLVQEPWVPPPVRDSLAALITELEAAAPPGLGDRRRAFRQQGQGARPGAMSLSQQQEAGWERLLEQRAELLVGVRLLRAGVLKRMSRETPDFECCWGQAEFGVEVTTRARPEAALAMHNLLERGLEDGPDVAISLQRTGVLLFSENPVTTAGIADRVVIDIREQAATGVGQPLSGRVKIPELGLIAWVHDGGPFTGPGRRVTYESLTTDEQWDHHWAMAARQIKDTVEKKGHKAYALPSILVLDVSRLGYVGQQVTETGIARLQEELDGCDLGNLGGVLVTCSRLTADDLTGLCWRGESALPLTLVGGAVLFGGDLPRAS